MLKHLLKHLPFKHFSVIIMLLAMCLSALAIEEQHGILVGVVQKLDAGAKTVVVKTADGTEHTFHFVKRSTVHGAEDTAKGAGDAFQGLHEGGEVAVHYTSKGGVETGDEFDRIGKDGLKSTDVTVTHIDRGAKTLAVKTADGTDETFRLTGSAAKDAGKNVVQGSEKSAKVTVYYSEEGGRKIVHFFKSSN